MPLTQQSGDGSFCRETSSDLPALLFLHVSTAFFFFLLRDATISGFVFVSPLSLAPVLEAPPSLPKGNPTLPLHLLRQPEPLYGPALRRQFCCGNPFEGKPLLCPSVYFQLNSGLWRTNLCRL
ncbi:hypothetical protein BHE74_00034234 [Ensete ventricosum]|nr:hypothetical protein BHE74_00034234 [Ensete ventricosum]